MNMTVQEEVRVGKLWKMIVGRGNDSGTKGFTWNIIIATVCNLLYYCSEHIIIGGRWDRERDL